MKSAVAALYFISRDLYLRERKIDKKIKKGKTLRDLKKIKYNNSTKMILINPVIKRIRSMLTIISILILLMMLIET